MRGNRRKRRNVVSNLAEKLTQAVGFMQARQQSRYHANIAHRLGNPGIFFLFFCFGLGFCIVVSWARTPTRIRVVGSQNMNQVL